jgi:predicted RNase H-like HicB family nuclease
MRRFTVVLIRDAGDDTFGVFVPELPGCFSQGDTVEKAIENAKEAIELHLQGLTEEGDEIPQEPALLVVTSVEIQEVPTAGGGKKPAARW